MIVAKFTSDWHLRHKRPSFRSTEKDWYQVMFRFFEQILSIGDDLSRPNSPPIFVAGDILDSAKEPPELINFLLDHMPTVYAIPGNHDLPNHNLKDIHKTSYYTLQKAGKIVNVPMNCPVEVGNVVVQGVPWGCKAPKRQTNSLITHVLLGHRFIYSGDKPFPGVDGSAHFT